MTVRSKKLYPLLLDWPGDPIGADGKGIDTEYRSCFIALRKLADAMLIEEQMAADLAKLAEDEAAEKAAEEEAAKKAAEEAEREKAEKARRKSLVPKPTSIAETLRRRRS